MDDVKIRFTKQDMALLDNLIKIVARAKHADYIGVEVIAAAEAMRWLSRLQKQAEDEFRKSPIEIVSNNPISEKKPEKKGKK